MPHKIYQASIKYALTSQLPYQIGWKTMKANRFISVCRPMHAGNYRTRVTRHCDRLFVFKARAQVTLIMFKFVNIKTKKLLTDRNDL